MKPRQIVLLCLLAGPAPLPLYAQEVPPPTNEAAYQPEGDEEFYEEEEAGEEIGLPSPAIQRGRQGHPRTRVSLRKLFF